MAAVTFMSCSTIGERFIVALATRQELPEELYEIAGIEGSRPLHTFRRIALPLMGPDAGAARLPRHRLQPAGDVRAGARRHGGPDRATTFLPLLIYDNAFENLRYGYAASMTVTMFLVTALVVLVQYRIVRRRRFGFGR